MKSISWTEKLYDYINNEEDARICKDIDESACEYTPKNYFLILLSNTFSKLGDTLSNPKTVLAWVMSYVNAPVYLISFIVPIRESGSMLPQLIIASYIRTKEKRKWVYVIGAVLQFLSMVAIGMVTLHTTGSTAGWLIILFLITFSLSRGLCSVASKDVLGKTIPKGRRGRLKGYTVSVSGILVLVAGLYMMYQSKNGADSTFYSYTIFFASVMWLISALIYAGIKEFPGATSGGQNGWKEALARMDLLRTDMQFRRFIIARSLLLCSALTAPFYVILAQRYLGKESYLLGLFIIANGLAAIISAPVWGRMADRSSKNVMGFAAIIASLLGVFMFCLVSFAPIAKNAYWLYPLAFFILGIAHSGVRLGRKTYIVDMAHGNKRTDYVAVSNTIIGGILLITGGISAAASVVSTEGVILVLSLFGLAGSYISYTLPNVE
ncbi:MFS-type transporter involved in bile tolerance, Atg22 family [Arenibacter nanhaiticus]|uniref:MFS-type transporter involved in bile tolerance, Atg22 family n=1 Tax=Arenibacter nanhaiticus TaxID=558155 RepID=A0A1M6FQ92_9FLAO|nr:MFS transporter [Arenibacter nanhaiticus]SHI99833.1 MFS-type transporter involved in bile tolerance, Atg22 family [Arenibacter nanhaiticus]